MKKQCSVFRPKNEAKWVDKSFNWKLVSKGSYLSAHENTNVWIPDDDLVFGVHDLNIKEIDDDLETNIVDFNTSD